MTKSILIWLVSFLVFANIAIMIILFSNGKKESEAENITPTESVESNKEAEESFEQEDEIEKPENNEVKRNPNTQAVARAANPINFEGTWNADGKATWEFYSGVLTINEDYKYNYSVAGNVDKNGYTIVTVNDPEGKYVVLLKKSSFGMEGMVAKGEDYQTYLKYGEFEPEYSPIRFMRYNDTEYARESNSIQSKDSKYINQHNEVIYYRVITGAYSNRKYAEREMYELISAGYEAVIIDPYQAHSVAGAEGLYSVMCGSYETPSDAENKASELRNRGFDAIIVEFRK